jgi:alkanesulfonate monooxygenase SsuD/methylene tetrahydromethanopterin reductase-like flavin-dependent oxidoreductase (luciferase family)
MLRLTAQFADAWNTCWLARADELPEKLATLHEACAEIGRDPATLEVTVGQLATFPGLDQEWDQAGELEKSTFVDVEDLAREFGNFATPGVGRLIVWPTPRGPECLGLVANALRIYRGKSAP